MAIKLNRESKQTGRDNLKECITSEPLPNKLFLMRLAITRENEWREKQQRGREKGGGAGSKQGID